MKALIDPLFIFYCLIWTTIKLWRSSGNPPTFLNSYLTDIVAVPVIAHIVLIITRMYFTTQKKYTYPIAYLLFLATYVSFVFELLMPGFSSKYTGDGIDVVCYFIGAMFYYHIHMPRVTESLAHGNQ
jgi:hypothetical protein